jgi:polo-like kinase 4
VLFLGHARVTWEAVCTLDGDCARTDSCPTIEQFISAMPSIRDYDIGQLLGRGGFASVHRARQRSTGKDVAIKIVVKARMTEPGMMDRIKNEIRIHSKLRHPNVVSFTGCFEDEHCVYMVLELCSHGNMFRYLKVNGPLSETLAVKVIQQLINALDYIHANGVVHRDLKLSNILLTGDMANNSHGQCDFSPDLVKICDFGLAFQKEHPDEEHFTLCGTPNYIAPEVVSQQSHGYPADLWSVGCLFYSMVVGTPPFERGDVKDTLRRIVSGEYRDPSSLSVDGVDFLRSLLHLVSIYSTYSTYSTYSIHCLVC